MKAVTVYLQGCCQGPPRVLCRLGNSPSLRRAMGSYLPRIKPDCVDRSDRPNPTSSLLPLACWPAESLKPETLRALVRLIIW